MSSHRVVSITGYGSVVLALLAGCQANPNAASRVSALPDSVAATQPAGDTAATTQPESEANRIAAITQEYVVRHGPQFEKRVPRASATQPAAMQPLTVESPARARVNPPQSADLSPRAMATAREESAVQWGTPEGTPQKASVKTLAPAPAVVQTPRTEFTQPQPVTPVDNTPSPMAQPVDSPLRATAASLVANPNAPVKLPADEPAGANGGAVFVPFPARGASELENALSNQLRRSPHDLWTHLDFQLLHYLRDEPTLRTDSIESLAQEDREMLRAIVDGLSNFRNTLRTSGNPLPAEKIRPLLEMADRLRTQAGLAIPTIALCRRVDGFGVYEPMEPARFAAGVDHEAIVYCEVENFSSTPVEAIGQRSWETRLSQEAIMYTESGMEVWNDKAAVVVDRSRNRRHDFFIVKKIKLPKTLTVGRYLLHVIVEDEQTNPHRMAEQTLPLEIVTQVK